MAAYNWPTNQKLIPARADLQYVVNARSNASAETGFTQGVTKPGSRWGWSLTLPAMSQADQAELEAYVARLSGYTHRARIYDWKRPRPRGTCNLAGVTVQSTVAQFATSVTLAGCGASATLRAGDWFAFAASGQLVMVDADATANGSGVMTVEFRWESRASVAAGTAVTLDAPTALYVLATPAFSSTRIPGRAQPGATLDLIEAFT